MTEMGNAHKTLLGKTEGKRPSRRSRLKLENNIKSYLKEMCCDNAD
jgi:hypothetical protein